MNRQRSPRQISIELAFEHSRSVKALLALRRWLDGSAASNSWLRLERRLASWLNGSRFFSPERIGSRPLEPGWSVWLRESLVFQAVWFALGLLWQSGSRAAVAVGGALRLLPLFNSSRLLSRLTAGIEDPGIAVAAVALTLPLVPTRYSLALILLSLLGLLLRGDRRPLHRWLRTPLDFPVFFFVVVLTVAAALSLDPRGSLITWAAWLLYIMFFYLVATRLDAAGLRLAVGALLFSTALLSLYGIYQYLVGVPAESAWIDQTTFAGIKTRVYSTLDNPNVLAEYLILVLPLALAAALASATWKGRLFSAGVLALGGLCLLLTLSRGGWAGFLFALALFATLKDRRALVLLVVGIAAAGFLLPSEYIGRAASIFNLQESSNSYRVSIWVAVGRMIKDFWVTGIGPGLDSFNLVYPHYSLSGGRAYHAHNFFLQVLLEMGVAGLISLLLLLWEFFRTGVRGLLISGGDGEAGFHRLLIVALIAGMGGYLLQGLTEHLWYSPRLAIAFWMMLGLMAAAVRLRSAAAAEGRWP